MLWGPQRGVYKNVATEISFFVLFFTVVSVSHKEWPNSSGKNNLCIFIHYFVSFDVRFAEFFLDGCLVSQRPHGEHNAIPANTNIFYDCNLNSGPFHFQSGYKESADSWCAASSRSLSVIQKMSLFILQQQSAP